MKFLTLILSLILIPNIIFSNEAFVSYSVPVEKELEPYSHFTSKLSFNGMVNNKLKIVYTMPVELTGNTPIEIVLEETSRTESGDIELSSDNAFATCFEESCEIFYYWAKDTPSFDEALENIKEKYSGIELESRMKALSIFKREAIGILKFSI